MHKTFLLVTICSWCCLATACVLFAQNNAEKKPKKNPDELKTKLVTVAVLSFDASDPSNPDMGVQLSEMATAALSGSEQFSLVDRTTLQQVLGENELSLTGLINSTEAIEVGKLVGAKILVTGRAFKMGQSKIITAKIIGTETSRIEGVMVKGDADTDLGDLAIQLAEKIDARIVKKSKMLTGADLIQKDPLPELIATLKKQKNKPVIAIVVTEEHIASNDERAVANQPDPAVETELKRILVEAGFEIRDVPQNKLAQWSDGDDWPKTLAGVDLIITGEAVSESASRIGNLINCTARAEINMISRENGRIVVADRSTSRAVDLAENVAGKTALQKAASRLAVPVLEYLISRKQ